MTEENVDWMHDKGTLWLWADYLDKFVGHTGEFLRQAMHDRDRFQRERDWWAEECRKRKPTQQDAWETQP